MNQARLLKGFKSAVLVMAVAAIAIVIFGDADFPAAFIEGKFWTTLGAAGLGGFIGGMLTKERKAKHG